MHSCCFIWWLDILHYDFIFNVIYDVILCKCTPNVLFPIGFAKCFTLFTSIHLCFIISPFLQFFACSILLLQKTLYIAIISVIENVDRTSQPFSVCLLLFLFSHILLSSVYFYPAKTIIACVLYVNSWGEPVNIHHYTLA